MLAEFGTTVQIERWLLPLLDVEIRSTFCMTEPDVASSDATNIATRIERDGDEYVINGRKWWSSGAMDPRCKLFIVMSKTNPSLSGTSAVHDLRPAEHARRHDQTEHASLRIHRLDARRSAEIEFSVSGSSHELSGRGDGFAIARPSWVWTDPSLRKPDRLGRAGARAMCRRSMSRVAWGKPIADRASCRTGSPSQGGIEQARLLVLKTMADGHRRQQGCAHRNQAIEIAVRG